MQAELLLPQIAWHDERAPIQSVDVSQTLGLIATAGNDNEVRLWKLRGGAQRIDGMSFVQSLSGHTKVSQSIAPWSQQVSPT